MRQGDFESETDPGVNSMEKSRSRFRGNPGISSGNASLNSTRIGNSMCYSLLASMSWIFTENKLNPFLMHFLSCKEDIYLTETFFGMP